jgi:predicted nuclease of restriction endonuclease-like (RecB) superfamily
MSLITTDKEYKQFIQNLKIEVKQARLKAVRSVNTQLIELYYNIGKKIVQKQAETNWGDNLIGQIEIDLKKEFPDITGFTRRNLLYMRKMHLFFGEVEKVPQAVAQIPWGHIRVILDKLQDLDEATFYIQETINNSWSRVILEHQIELGLYKRQGKTISNFEGSIEPKDLEAVNSAFKDPYIFDFLNLSSDLKERDLEQALIDNITSFLLEMGKGFAFIGRQYKLTVAGDEFFIDLLFYNYILKRFVVIELKTTKFEPEFAGKLGFYLTAVDRQVKTETDKETIGLLICKDKNSLVVDYAIGGKDKPMAVAEYKLSEMPSEFANCLPSKEEIESAINVENL